MWRRQRQFITFTAVHRHHTCQQDNCTRFIPTIHRNRTVQRRIEQGYHRKRNLV